MFGLNFSMSPALRRVVFLSLLGVAGCGGANSCCDVPPGVNKIGGVIPPGSGPPIVITVPGVTIGNGGSANVPVPGPGPFTAVGCPGIVNATVNGSIVNLVGVGVGTCVVVVTSPNGGQGTITVTVSPSPPLIANPTSISLVPGASGGITLNGPGPFTATGCPGIINATVNGNVVNLVAVGVGVCAVVVTGPGGIQAIVNATVSANAPLAVNPGAIQLGAGGTGAVTITGTGPFTATGCPGIVSATVNGNVLNLVGLAAGVCVVVVTDANGVKATVVTTVSAATPLTVTPTTINLGPGGTGSIAITGSGPFTATGCPGIIDATVSGNIVNVAAVGAGVCVIVITGPNGLQATVLATVSATPAIALSPTTVQLGNGGSSAIAITGTGPFTATGCPGIINATVSGNVLNLAAIGVGVCAVVVIGPGGVQATVLATVTAVTPLVALPATVILSLLTSPLNVTVTGGTGPFTATGCPGIVSAAVAGSVVTLTRIGVGVCAVVIADANGLQTTVLVTST